MPKQKKKHTVKQFFTLELAHLEHFSFENKVRVIHGTNQRTKERKNERTGTNKRMNESTDERAKEQEDERKDD